MIEVKVDNSIGESLIPFLKNAQKRLVVASPWLHPSYARLLADKKNQGVHVTVFTTDSTTGKHQEAVLEFVERVRVVMRESRPQLMKARILLLFAAILPFMLAVLVSQLLWVILGVFLVVVAILLHLWGREEVRYESQSILGNDNLIVYHDPDDPFQPGLHTKIYVADDEIAIGSPNLTIKGMQKSVESLVIIRDKGVADEIVSRLSALKDNASQYGLQPRSLEDAF